MPFLSLPRLQLLFRQRAKQRRRRRRGQSPEQRAALALRHAQHALGQKRQPEYHAMTVMQLFVHRVASFLPFGRSLTDVFYQKWVQKAT